jgi:hypothetical protein
MACATLHCDFNGAELWFSKAFPGFQRPSKRTIAVQLQQELNGESRRTFLFRLSGPPAQAVPGQVLDVSRSFVIVTLTFHGRCGW